MKQRHVWTALVIVVICAVVLAFAQAPPAPPPVNPPTGPHFFITGGFSVSQETDITNSMFVANCADTDTSCTQTLELCPQTDSMSGCVDLVNGTNTFFIVQKTTKAGQSRSARLARVDVTAQPWKIVVR